MRNLSIGTFLGVCAAVLLAGAEKKDDLENTPQLMVYKDQIGYRDGLRYYKKRLFTGVVVSRHENGQRKMYVTYKDGKRHGLSTGWYENGQKQYEETYKDGKQHGLATYWYENGQKSLEASYKDGKTISKKEWDYNGNPK